MLRMTEFAIRLAYCGSGDFRAVTGEPGDLRHECTDVAIDLINYIAPEFPYDFESYRTETCLQDTFEDSEQSSVASFATKSSFTSVPPAKS